MIKKDSLWFSIRIFKLPNWKFRFGCLFFWFWRLINLSACCLNICDYFPSIVSVSYSRLAFQYLLFHWIVKSTFPNVDWLLRSSWNKIIALSAELCTIWMSFKSVLKFSFLRIPYFCCTIIRRRYQIRTMWMKIDGLYWTFMTLIDLNNMLWS